jgi:hypothetical protein
MARIAEGERSLNFYPRSSNHERDARGAWLGRRAGSA